jgi:hypothetical protein
MLKFVGSFSQKIYCGSITTMEIIALIHSENRETHEWCGQTAENSMSVLVECTVLTVLQWGPDKLIRSPIKMRSGAVTASVSCGNSFPAFLGKFVLFSSPEKNQSRNQENGKSNNSPVLTEGM